MKQNHSGQRVVNWHRPYDHTQLSRGYLRRRATAGMSAIVSLCCNGMRRVTVEIRPLTRYVSEP